MSTPGVGGPGGPEKTGGSQPDKGVSGEALDLNIKVGTLGQLKNVLIEKLGKKEGMKFYNNFVKSMEISAYNQMKQAAASAKAAAKRMGDSSKG